MAPDSQTLPSVDISHTSQLSSKQKISWSRIFIVFLVALFSGLIFGCIGYIMGMNSQSNSLNSSQPGIASSISIPTATPIPQIRQLITLPPFVTNVSYTKPEAISNFTVQTITYQLNGRSEGIGVEVFPNTQHLTASQWLTKTWDPKNLIITEPVQTSLGEGVNIIDSQAYRTQQSPVSGDFPAEVVIATNNKIIVVDHLNGISTPKQDVLKVASSLLITQQ